MTKRFAWTKTELKRAVEAAQGVGYEVRLEGRVIRLLPIVSEIPVQDDDERRMLEAFGK